MPTTPSGMLQATAEARDPTAVLAVAAGTLRSWVGAGPVFLASADPVTGEFAAAVSVDIPQEASARFLANEMSGSDVVQFAALARSAVPVGTLFGATAEGPRGSARWREVLEPLGWGDELRAAVRTGSTTWGYVCLHRESADRPFTATDVARLTRVLPVLAAALRRVALPLPAPGSGLGSGVVLVGPGDRLVATSGAAADWLAECDPVLPSGLPLPVAALARRVLRSGRPAAVVLPTRTGRRASLEAAPLRGGAPDQVAIVVGAATADQTLDRLAAVTGLTRRERDVVRAAVRGRSTRGIAGSLHISEQTVQTHLRSIFGKTGTHSRRELVGRLGG